MGMFSWCCAKTNKSIPGAAGVSVVVVLPDNVRVFGKYDGYGRLMFPKAFNSAFEPVEIKDLGVVLDDEGEFDIHCAYASHVVPHFRERRQDFIKGNYDIVMSYVKMVHHPEYHGESYRELDVSMNCPYQGHFYNFDTQCPCELDEEDEDPLDPCSGCPEKDKEFFVGEKGCDLTLAYEVLE